MEINWKLEINGHENVLLGNEQGLHPQSGKIKNNAVPGAWRSGSVVEPAATWPGAVVILTCVPGIWELPSHVH